MSNLLDGAALAQEIRLQCKQSAEDVFRKIGRKPGLAVILVGNNSASEVYVKHKVSDCHEVGFESSLLRLPEDATQAQLLELITSLNQDRRIDGILVQLPLPATIDTRRVLETIDPAKDVDGFHVVNAGSLMTGNPLFRPCTPYGVMKLLEKAGTPLRGAEAVVIGASNIVGKPQAMMLLQAGATVTICNSKTKDLAAHTRRADVLVVAVGRAKMITGDMLKEGVTVIDVGMNRDENGKLCGDVDFASASKKAAWITPVPGGVGPMTRAMLLVNTLESAQRAPKSL
jgi:methylenetetrahydrofolate dehydrogenase (NADP+) / methenyltetrahydrofolate cyclohydrolase